MHKTKARVPYYRCDCLHRSTEGGHLKGISDPKVMCSSSILFTANANYLEGLLPIEILIIMSVVCIPDTLCSVYYFLLRRGQPMTIGPSV